MQIREAENRKNALIFLVLSLLFISGYGNPAPIMAVHNAPEYASGHTPGPVPLNVLLITGQHTHDWEDTTPFLIGKSITK